MKPVHGVGEDGVMSLKREQGRRNNVRRTLPRGEV